MTVLPPAKGRHHRCASRLYVGGIKTGPGERVWVLRDGVPVRVRSARQLAEHPERALVLPAPSRPRPADFAADVPHPPGGWAGMTSRPLARGGRARRAELLAEQTAAAHPALTARVRAGPHLTVADDPAARLGADAASTHAVATLAADVAAHGGRLLVVGGAVRDMLRRRLAPGAAGSPGAVGTVGTVQDLDVEVFGLAPDALVRLVEARWPVDRTGASFEVLKAHVPDAPHPLDVSLPRRERAVGAGHKDFLVTADPTMSFAEAAARRDFTIGALGYDPRTGELLDPYGGLADLTAGVLRHVGPAFKEDPLRVLRAARFAARFDLAVHPATATLCRGLWPQADTLPRERVWSELAATLDQAARPGRMLHVLDELDWIGLHPELAALRAVAQEPDWHPEGDVFVHTALVLDYWGQHLRTGDQDDDRVVALAALCHDLGKPATTRFADGRWRAHGHEAAGLAPTRAFLSRMGQLRLQATVLPLVEHHLAPMELHRAQASDRAVRRLATKVGRLDLLARVCEADQGGRPPLTPERAREACGWLLERAEALGVAQGPSPALLRGEHLAAAGMSPGPAFKPILAAAYEAQLDGTITDEASALVWLAGHLDG